MFQLKLVILFVKISWILRCINPVTAESLELRLNEISGLTRDVKGRTEYFVVVHECSPVCTLVGTESIADRQDAHFLSSEGLHGSFRLSIKLRRRTRPPPQQRIDIPVEVVELEGTLSELTENGYLESGMQFMNTHSHFDESNGRVLLTGSQPGEKGNLNHHWRERDELVAEYIVDTTMSAIRRCRKSCRFHSSSSFVQRSISNATFDVPTFEIQLSAFREGAMERSDPAHLLLAAHFADATERSLKKDIHVPFQHPGQRSYSGDLEQGARDSSQAGQCYQYRFVASVGDEVAYVWYLSSHGSKGAEPKKDQLDTGSNEEVTIIVFKDIPSTSPHYVDVWNRNELSPVSFKGTSTYPHFESIGSLGKVHAGFQRRYNSIAEELRTWVRPGANVLVTGVFTGGAMGMLAYVDWLSDRGMDVGRCYGVAFGAPQVGDKLFQRAFRELGRYEPTRNSFGFFEQMVAANENTGKVDIATTVPSSLFEGIVPYPGIHSLDCLREVLPIEKMALSAPGHLRVFRSVGRRRYLYGGRWLGHNNKKRDFKHIGKASNDSLKDMAEGVFRVYGRPMDEYFERAYSLYFDSQHAHARASLRSVSKVQIHDVDCGGNRVSKNALIIDVELILGAQSSKNADLILCDDCSPSESCRAMIGNVLNDENEKRKMRFVTLRPFTRKACIYFHLVQMKRGSTCGSRLLPLERSRVRAGPGVAVADLIKCGKKERCHMQLDGIKFLISGTVRPGYGEEEHKGEDGLLQRSGTEAQPNGEIENTVDKDNGVLASSNISEKQVTRVETISNGMQADMEEDDGRCETASHCRCISTTAANCATPISGQIGWCSVSTCHEMRCSCEGDRLCAKEREVVSRVVEGGGKFVRCETGIGVVVREV